ncbi:MAG: plasmid mobilization relaxosome protein MobC [Oscillospiraceae bacterium]|nr:plasmid mobilization relaxosome protein MobC [Oscillospiraceae bacterium]
MRNNVKSVLLRLDAAELSKLDALVQTSGLKREQVLRKLILGVELRPRPPDALGDLLRELSAIGNNVNQIAYWANARRGITDERIREAQELVRQALRLIKERL